jgi:hypothetical protein
MDNNRERKREGLSSLSSSISTHTFIEKKRENINAIPKYLLAIPIVVNY